MSAVLEIQRLDPGNFVDVDVGAETFRQNAFRSGMLAAWARRPPLYCQRGGLEIAVCARHADVRELYMDTERVSVAVPNLPGYDVFDLFDGIESVLQMDGAKHERIRRLMNPAFAPKAVNALREATQEIVDDKLQAIIAKGGDFDAVADFAGDLIVRVLFEASFQFSKAEKDSFIRVHDSFALVAGLKAGDPRPQEYLDAAAAANDVILDVIARRRRVPGTDFISQLVTARDEGDQLSDQEMIDQIYTSLAAAIGTTATSMATMLMLLARNPDQYALLRREPELLENGLEECLRLHTSGIFSFPRFALHDMEIGETLILKDMPIYPSIQAANLDPTEFPDPLRLDVRRPRKSHMSFGSGAHHCIGHRLARLILRTGLQGFIDRFDVLELANPDFEPTYFGAFGEMSPVSLPMRVRPSASGPN